AGSVGERAGTANATTVTPRRYDTFTTAVLARLSCCTSIMVGRSSADREIAVAARASVSLMFTRPELLPLRRQAGRRVARDYVCRHRAADGRAPDKQPAS